MYIGLNGLGFNNHLATSESSLQRALGQEQLQMPLVPIQRHGDCVVDCIDEIDNASAAHAFNSNKS